MLRRFTNNNGTTILTYPFDIEEHQYSSAGSNQHDTYYYSLGSTILTALRC
jgi:hypothetical protein